MARASPQRAGFFLSGGFALSIVLRPSGTRGGLRAGSGGVRPHIVDHEAAHHAAERQAVAVRPRVCASRTFDREREGMGDHV
jgi:hypothetical protein